MKTKRFFYFILLLLISVLAIGFYVFIKNNKGENFNIFLIVVDTLRADHLGCYGYHRNTSPEIDRMAKEGFIFKSMLAQSSWTRPGTASILTGLYPKNHGANTKNDRLVKEIQLLPEILEKHGYNCYAFITNGNAGDGVGFNQGYKKFIRFPEKMDSSTPNIHVRSDVVNKTVIELLDNLGPQQKSKNFIYIHYSDPHAPYIPKERHFSKSNRFVFNMDFFKMVKNMSKEARKLVLEEMIDAYDDEVLQNDKMIGQLIQVLKKKKMYENSIFIITSDHGEEFFEHEKRGHGLSLYDEQLKVPLILKVPNRGHREIGSVANQVDIVPTILKVLKVPIPQYLDGINLLENKKKSHRFSFAELNAHGMILSAIQTSNEKLIEGICQKTRKYRGRRWFRNKASFKTPDNSIELNISSFYNDRTVQISVEGKIIKQLIVTPKQQTFSIPLPNFPQVKTVIIKSLSPCQSPKDLGISENPHCRGFLIFDSHNVKVENILNEPQQEYFLLNDDPWEQNNRYHLKEFKKAIVLLRKVIKKYLTNRFKPSNPKPVKFDKKQLQVLKELGYLD